MRRTLDRSSVDLLLQPDGRRRRPQIGHVPKVKAEWLAVLLDAGVISATARVTISPAPHAKTIAAECDIFQTAPTPPDVLAGALPSLPTSQVGEVLTALILRGSQFSALISLGFRTEQAPRGRSCRASCATTSRSSPSPTSRSPRRSLTLLRRSPELLLSKRSREASTRCSHHRLPSLQCVREIAILV